MKALTAIMREADRLAAYSLAHRPPSGMVGVGSEGVPEEYLAEALRLFVAEHRRGKSVREAREAAGELMRYAIREHNKRRPKDLDWGRWTEHGQDKLDWAMRLLLEETRR